MPIKDLSPGRHTLTVKAWDIFNNSGEGSTSFTVSNGNIEVFEHAAFPNPFSNEVGIWFRHNMPGRNLTADVEVTDLQGRALHRFQKEIENANSREVRLYWTGNGAPMPELQTAILPSGVYFYRVKLSHGEVSTSFSGKMVKILR